MVAVVSVTAACGGASEARRVADRFMALYYDDAHVADAVRLCTGQAKARLDAEIKFLEGAPTTQQAPTSFRLHAEKREARNRVTYVYRVHLGRADATPLFARLVLVRDGGRWLVAEFYEKERVSHRGAG